MNRILPEPFPAGARVVFAGDSITCAHDHVARIAAHYRLHEASRGVRFWNAGTSGASVSWLLEAFDSDIARWRPTHVPIMIGVNDSDRDALRLDPSDPAREERLNRAFDRYRANLPILLDRVAGIGAQAILCTPTPYAEFSPFTNWDTLHGGHALILRYADEVRRIAALRGLPLVDFHAHFCERYPIEKLYGDDRVHPTPEGHRLMANLFLGAQGLGADDFATVRDAADAAGLGEWLTAWQRYRNLVSANFLCFSPQERAWPVAERVERVALRLSGNDPGNPTPEGWWREVMEIFVADAASAADISARLDAMNDALFARPLGHASAAKA